MNHHKIFHAFMAGTIPIYYGSPDIIDYFNPKSFINCHDYSNFEKVIERVIEIDKSPELFAQYLYANPIHINSKIYNYTPDLVYNKTDAILQQALQKRNTNAQSRYPLFHLSKFTFAVIIIAINKGITRLIRLLFSNNKRLKNSEN